MRRMTKALLSLAAFSASSGIADEPSTKPVAPTPASEAIRARNPEGPHRPADSDSPLAEGWPPATEPGMIEVKTYPPYRSAVARASGASMGADNVLFWPLFNHISRKGVEMTTPVVNTYQADVLEGPKATGDMSMEFVYRTTTLGEAGDGVGAVKVEDHPGATYVCLGLQGGMSAKRLQDGVAELTRWLESRKADWEPAGPARRLGYHGPMTPVRQRLWEVQLPIKPVAK